MPYLFHYPSDTEAICNVALNGPSSDPFVIFFWSFKYPFATDSELRTADIANMCRDLAWANVEKLHVYVGKVSSSIFMLDVILSRFQWVDANGAAGFVATSQVYISFAIYCVKTKVLQNTRRPWAKDIIVSL